MTTPIDDNQIDRQLTDAFIAPPEANFDAWQRKHSEAVSLLNQDRTLLLLKRRKLMKRTLKLAATAALLAATWFGVSQFTGPVVHSTAYAENALADVAKQIKKAKTITWKTTMYEEHLRKDNKTKWYIETRTDHNAFQAPGVYRHTTPDKNGKVSFTTVSDQFNLKELTLHHAKKEAKVREMAMHDRGVNGPFHHFHSQDFLSNDWSTTAWVETKTVDGRKVNVFRHSRKDAEVTFGGQIGMKTWSMDFWLDAKTKDLVRVQSPGADIYDVEKALVDNHPPADRDTTIRGIGRTGWIQHDIVFNADVDESLFSTEPPEGFTVERIARPTVSEEEMIEYLDIVAEYSDKTFPDKVIPHVFSSNELNRIWDKERKDRTKIEQKLLDIRSRYKMTNLNMMPFRHFIQDHTVKDTWRYLGKGIKLGDKDRIVCWYKPNGATKYRAVYGDLSVKDIVAEDLPLKVKP